MDTKARATTMAFGTSLSCPTNKIQRLWAVIYTTAASANPATKPTVIPLKLFIKMM